MMPVYIQGCGVVSPAGWGIQPFRDALLKGVPLPTAGIARPGWSHPMPVRQTPPSRPQFLSQSRLRRTSPISNFAVAAAFEALGPDKQQVLEKQLSPGIVLCVMSGCVNYSRRFYDETLRDPATASPLVFPETVFNAPASHLAAVLGTTAINYTLVGDPGAFLQGLAMAATWLAEGRVDACLVVGAEECDWLTADAYRLFTPDAVLSDGAGALYLRNTPSDSALAQLHCVTDSHSWSTARGRMAAASQVRAQLPASDRAHLLCDSRQKIVSLDAAESEAWRDWTGGRLSPKIILGEGLMAGSAWQCAAAIDAMQSTEYEAASISVVGCNQQAIGAHFTRPKT